MLAERGRIRGAGVVVGLALLTRPTAIALVPPLVLIAGRRSWRLATALPIAAAYPLLLWWKLDDPWAFAQRRRHVAQAPVTGRPPRRNLGRAARRLGRSRAARVGLERTRLLDGRRPCRLDTPLRTATLNLLLLGFLVLFVALTVIAWREVGAPYGLFAALSLALPLSVPSSRWPLLSLPRFGLVTFPFFLALAWVGGRNPRAHAAILGFSGLLLGIFVTQWALWDWVA